MSTRMIACFLANKKAYLATLGVCLLGMTTVQAQNDAVVSLHLYAGLTIYGVTGSNYTVQCVSDLAQTNSENNWQTLTNLALPTNPYIWSDYSAPATGTRFYRVISSNNIPANPDAARLTWISPGNFTMGSPSTEAERQPGGMDETPHGVTISRGFYLGKYPVTQAEFQAVMGRNPSIFVGNPNNPVEQVSWYDATNYCSTLNQKERAAGRLPDGWQYRLPTEAEWEYTCRAGTISAFNFGDTILAGMANFDAHFEYNANSVGTITTNTAGVGYIGKTTPVGSYAANAWGLYDMSGNVFEWCQDWFGDYSADSVIDPTGPTTGDVRVARGGSWSSRGTYCRSAVRHFTPPNHWRKRFWTPRCPGP